MRNVEIFNELSEHVNIRINSCKDVRHDSRWAEVYAHVDYDMWFITSGKVMFVSNGTEYAANTGDVVFFYPDSLYNASTGKEGCSFIYIHFDMSMDNNQRILNDFSLSGVIPGGFIFEEVRMLKDGYDRYKRNIQMSSILLKGYLTILIARIMELYGKGNYTGGFSGHIDYGADKRKLSSLQPVFSYIKENKSSYPRIKELAEIAGMSEKYFITYFKASLGMTPGQYIYQVKMNRAREYIYMNEYTIKEIAYLLGYPDQYTFSKAFKKYYKMPPSKFV